MSELSTEAKIGISLVVGIALGAMLMHLPAEPAPKTEPPAKFELIIKGDKKGGSISYEEDREPERESKQRPASKPTLKQKAKLKARQFGRRMKKLFE